MEITTETSRRTHICPRLGVEVCALVIIDSGNPTDNASVNISLKEIITFCHRESLILLIDNLYYTTQGPPIYSRKLPSHWNIKVLFNMISKCLIGECEKEKRGKVFRVYGNRFDGGGYKDCKYEFMS